MFFFNKFSFHFSDFSEYLAYFFFINYFERKTGIGLWVEGNLALGSAYGLKFCWHWDQPMD
jgi:hypothetical protein